MKKEFKTLILLILIFCLVNTTFISAYIIFIEYGSATLSPGEDYIVNIPFITESNMPTICGKAQTTQEEVLQDITVSVYYGEDLIGKETTDSNGDYCIDLPEITSNRKYDIFVEYDTVTNSGKVIELASNDYTLDLEDNRIFSKSQDKFVTLQGEIENQDAEIDNGRFEINLQYWPNETEGRYEVFDYQKYTVNINPDENYPLPNNELNFSWEIPDDAELGRYKFYIKTSFNAKERTKNIYFTLVQ